MYEAVVRKLRLFGAIGADDEARLVKICAGEARETAAGTDLIVEGENPRCVHLITSGFACRYKILADGKRQIVAFLVPGDFCDLHTFVMRSTDHSIATMAPSTIVGVPKRQIEELMELPSLVRPMLMSTLVDEATLREWIANIGQRPAPKRLAHLFCELHLRLKNVGLATNEAFELPLTQSDLGDTLGLSTVHVNRSMKELRHRQLLSTRKKSLVIHDHQALEAFCDFNPNYLFLGGVDDQKAAGTA